MGEMGGPSYGGEEGAISGTQGSVPQPILNANAPPPFLSKTYDMVDDSATDAIVSWSHTNNSFVVWNPPEFSRDLLPKYFKHNNFSSFVRQLNTYGFRKVDPDRWEFANEGFLRDQKHLLKSINRRKPAHGQSQPPQQSVQNSSPSGGACVEVGKFGLEEEVERLKRDKNVLMQELVRLRQQQQTTDSQLQVMVQRLQGMEQRQQQMMSFLAKAVQSPGFLSQFVQQQNESSRCISEANKKRRLKQDGIPESNLYSAPDGQIVKYQPFVNEAAKAMLRQIMNIDTSRVGSLSTNSDSFLIGNGLSQSPALDSGSSTSCVSGVTLQEVPPTSGKPSYVAADSGISGRTPSATISEFQSSPTTTSGKITSSYPDINVTAQAQDSPPFSTSQKDVIPELSEMTEVPESIGDASNEGYMQQETDNDVYIDPDSLDIISGIIPIDIDNISNDPDIDALINNSLMGNSNFWSELLQSPVEEELEANLAEGLSLENGAFQMENGWDKFQYMDKLTTQMGLLTSNNKKD